MYACTHGVCTWYVWYVPHTVIMPVYACVHACMCVVCACMRACVVCSCTQHIYMEVRGQLESRGSSFLHSGPGNQTQASRHTCWSVALPTDHLILTPFSFFKKWLLFYRLDPRHTNHLFILFTLKMENEWRRKEILVDEETDSWGCSLALESLCPTNGPWLAQLRLTRELSWLVWASTLTTQWPCMPGLFWIHSGFLRLLRNQK